MTPKDYHLFWYDSYSAGYIRGVTHAVADNGISLCGRNLSGDIGKSPVDGGYQNCDEELPGCKICRKKIIALIDED